MLSSAGQMGTALSLWKCTKTRKNSANLNHQEADLANAFLSCGLEAGTVISNVRKGDAGGSGGELGALNTLMQMLTGLCSPGSPPLIKELTLTMEE